MSLRFVTGPAGSGKSTYLYDMLISQSIKEPKRDFLLIVPDQFTMQTQSDIIARHPNKAVTNLDILSFGRLSYRIFEETGAPKEPTLDDTGKSLVLRHVASSVAKDMPYLGKHLNKIGYIHEIKSAISEFMQYGLSVEDIRRLSGETGSELLNMKLNDLSIIYEAFMKYNKDKFITGEETLDKLCKAIDKSEIVKDSVVVFDGFTGFTPIQERVIERLIERASDVYVSLTLSHDEDLYSEGNEESLFYLSRMTAKRLQKISERIGVKAEVYKELKSSSEARFKESPMLNHLEKNLFKLPFEVYKNTTDDIRIINAANISTEVDIISGKINDLIMSGQYAYRDIAVICGDFESYASLFEERFNKLNMACFIDRTNSIVLNPFIEFLESAIEIIIKDYSYDSVFHLLRSGFTDFDEEETDRFDCYIKSLNIRGSQNYHKEFRRKQTGIADKDYALLMIPKMNEIREKLIKFMEPLERKASTAEDYCKALYEFITNNVSFARLEKMAKEFEEDNRPSLSVEYGQIYRLIINLLDTIVSLVGSEEMSIAEFYEIFKAGIGEIKVGTIPKGVDRIVVGDIERTRLKEIKALFLVGVNDGNIPRRNNNPGILSTIERKKLCDKGIDLAPTERQEMYTQRLYLYINLCKPSNKLCLSSSGIGADGKSVLPSYLIGNITRLYENLEPEKIKETADERGIITLKDSLRVYSVLMRKYAEGRVSENERSLLKALRHLYDEENMSNEASKITDGAFMQYVAKPLSKEMARLLYNNVIEGSVSRFEQYARCAYEQFLTYGMELKEAETFDFERNDLGNVCHSVLDEFARRIEEQGYTFKDFPDDKLSEILEASISEVTKDYGQGILFEDDKNRYIIERITTLMKRTIKTLKYQLSRGQFLPRKFEYRFSHEYELDDEARMILKGRIDRIDICKTDDKVYIKITDYKSSSHDLDVTKIYYGIEQQLITYMNEAVLRERSLNPDKDIVPSALFYYAMKNPIINEDGLSGDEQIERKIKKELILKGMVSTEDDNVKLLDENAMGEGDILPISYSKDGKVSGKGAATREEIENMLKYVEKLSVTVGNNILKGDIRISPIKDGKNDSCTYCPYGSVCRFDEKIPGFEGRRLDTVNADQAREIVMGGAEDVQRDKIFS